MDIPQIKTQIIPIAVFLLLLISACQSKVKESQNNEPDKGTFGYDVDFLKKYQETVVLENDGSMLAICPAYQGRVMTSTSNGRHGLSYGWLNYDLIKSGEILAHINPVGGEDRFWLGPEGGQFSIFFKQGDQFNLNDWQTPAAIDTETYNIVEQTKTSVSFGKEFSITNYSGTEFDLEVQRDIKLLSVMELTEVLQADISEELDVVAFQTSNTITNRGQVQWTKETGALSIWVLGMFNPSPSMTVIVPFVAGDEDKLGPIVNDSYFGKVPQERLVVSEELLYFKGDGLYRSKIGLNPKRAKPLLGSYDAETQVLTVVVYSKPEGVSDYVNSMWEMQDEPFAGDVVNSYNDGPVDGNALGPFYELETSSPAAFLAPEASMTHEHTTIHIQGDETLLSDVAQKLFSVDIQTIKSVFP